MADVTVDKRALIEGEDPMYNASYGKLMMWFFLVSDAFTFSAFLITYGALRFRISSEGFQWAVPEDVFTHFPLFYELHIKEEMPLVFVGLMTFILILSSVTMVLAVEAGHRRAKDEVAKWVLWTIVGGATFLGCQAYEWYHFIHGFEDQGRIISISDYAENSAEMALFKEYGLDKEEEVKVLGVWSSERPVRLQDWGFFSEPVIRDSDKDFQYIRGLRLTDGTLIREVEVAKNLWRDGAKTTGGANLHVNEYGPPAFADLFFFVTGFHGTHVFSGVILLIILYINVKKGTYERRGHYEMTEKIGLYWHFVDLVWVFVFTCFYLL